MGSSFVHATVLVAMVAMDAPPERRAEALAGMFLAGYIGLSLPVVALGVMTQYLSARLSLLIFTGIVVGLPGGITELVNKAQTSAWGGFTPIAILLLVVLMITVVAFIIFVERSERRIPIQSAKRMVGRSVQQASSSFLPLKVNSGGVMPVIFAASILSAPLLLANVSPTGVGLSSCTSAAVSGPWLITLTV